MSRRFSWAVAAGTLVLLGSFVFLGPDLASALAPTGVGAGEEGGEGNAPQAPATVYEAEEKGPENMDYDAERKLFLAHSGWLNDRLIHYYKFRMYTPGTYPSKVQPGEAPRIPVAPLYLPTSDGTFSGIPEGQRPILRYHHVDGEAYSDFVRVVWVRVPEGYQANELRSYEDIVESRLPIQETEIVANMPLVPAGSRLEKPGGGFAPIRPLLAWYRGFEVQTFVFEATDQAFAAHYNPRTREGDAAQPGSGFEITVSPFATPERVSFAPIFHLNQYSTGVTPGVNHGGPSPTGQRNVIGVDRGDPAYSPLWQVMWVTKVPPGYRADQASHPSQFTKENGFEVAATPMFVNCPDIGPRGGGAGNEAKAPAFDPTPRVTPGDTLALEGSLVMEEGKEVRARAGERVLANATTGPMGAWRIAIPTSALPGGETAITIEDSEGNLLATYDVEVGSVPVPVPTALAVAALAAAAALGGLRLRRRA